MWGLEVAAHRTPTSPPGARPAIWLSADSVLMWAPKAKSCYNNEIQGLDPTGIGDRRAVAVCKRAGVGCRVCRACGVTVMTDDALILMCVECAAVTHCQSSVSSVLTA